MVSSEVECLTCTVCVCVCVCVCVLSDNPVSHLPPHSVFTVVVWLIAFVVLGVNVYFVIDQFVSETDQFVVYMYLHVTTSAILAHSLYLYCIHCWHRQPYGTACA